MGSMIYTGTEVAEHISHIASLWRPRKSTTFSPSHRSLANLSFYFPQLPTSSTGEGSFAVLNLLRILDPLLIGGRRIGLGDTDAANSHAFGAELGNFALDHATTIEAHHQNTITNPP